MLSRKTCLTKFLVKTTSKGFSHGPYNPLNYRTKLVPERRITTEESYYLEKKALEVVKADLKKYVEEVVIAFEVCENKITI